jgi:hypothetical protein
MTDRCYAITGPTAMRTVISALADRFDGIRKTAGSETVTVLDSFDWRLFNKGWLLQKTPNRYTIVDIHTGQPIVDLALKDAKPLQFH